jgi:ectoine hydroxylase
MKLRPDELATFHRDGFVLRPASLDGPTLDPLDAELEALFARDSPRRVLELDGKTVRSVYGCHQVSARFDRLIRHPALLEPARQLVDGDVYLYQLKVNAKRARSGDRWAWHQDLIYWRDEDGLPGDRIVNVALFLDEVTPDNAPLQVLPGSHRLGVVETAPNDEGARAYGGQPSFITDLIAEIKYRLDDPTVEALTATHGVATVSGPRGSVLVFDANLVHASPPNRSSRDRRMLVATYNRCDNLPARVTRPDFLVGRDHAPL